MSSPFDQHAAALASTESYYGTGVSNVNWNGVDYHCLSGSKFGGQNLGEGGYRTTAKERVVVRTALFGSTRPQEKQTVVFTNVVGGAAVKLRIDSTTLSAGDIFMILELNDPNESA